MHWPPDIADDLPAPRDDEPSSLRQDIADELADHLQCAFTRELHVTRDERAAQQKALDRFGDPRAVARTLWFDALRDKIMSQRLTFVALAVVLLASLGSTAATWFVVTQLQTANEAMLAQSREATAEILAQSRDANKALLEQSQQANAALIEKLGQLPGSDPDVTESAPSLEWNPVKVRLYAGEKPGVPAAGFTIALIGHVLDTSKAVTISRMTDDTGLADFGLVRPGQHALRINAPWGERPNELPLYVLPGKAVAEEIPCPAKDFPNAELRFEVDWPEDLKARGCWLICQLVQTPRAIGGRNWTRPPPVTHQFVLLGPESQLVPFPFGTNSHLVSIDRGQGFYSWPFQHTGNGPQDVRGLHADRNFLFSAAYRKLVSESRRTKPDSDLQLADQFDFIFGNVPAIPHQVIAATEWRLEALLICDRPHEISLEEAWKIRTGRFGQQSAVPVENLDSESRVALSVSHLLGGLLPNGGMVANMVNRGPSDRVSFYHPLTDWTPLTERNETPAAIEARLREQPHFVAVAGKPNIWKITLPERLLERVRNNPDFRPSEPERQESDAMEKDAPATAAESNGP